MNLLTAEIINIGAELLKGSVLNTNAQFLGKELTGLGFHVEAQVSCGDSLKAIEESLGLALSHADLIILSGGLGPTPDDVTRDSLAQFFKVPLVFSRSQFSLIQKNYRRYGQRIVPSQVKKEAYYPQNAKPLMNRFGIALGFTIRCGNRLIVVLPGVPSELEKMFAQQVKPLLKRHFKNREARPSLAAKTVGISEPEVMKRLGEDFFRDEFEFGIYPEAGEVSLRIYAAKVAVIRRLKKKIKKRLAGALYSQEETGLSETVGQKLIRKKRWLAVAESCTGGRLASDITRVAGASRYFKGSVITYDNRIKEQVGVSKKILKTKGAVSKEVAIGLAHGVRNKMDTYYGIGVTGIAGPSGGSRQKPVGLVYISLATPKKVRTEKFLFWGDRNQIQTKASKKALEFLWQDLR